MKNEIEEVYSWPSGRRRKLTPREILTRKLDKAWSLAVRDKYPRCIMCGTSPTQAHHAIVRKAQGMGVRWILENGVGLCVGCHLFKLHGQQSDKMWLDKYITILNDLVPSDMQQVIVDMGHTIKKYDISELEEILKQLTSK